MNRMSGLLREGRRSACALCMVLTLVQGVLWADVVVSRSITPKAGGCTVELSWEVSGKVESDLIIEERFSEGWSVDLDTLTPVDSLDAKWASPSASVARFAVKPSSLTSKSSISFDVKATEGITAGTVAGDWRMYLDGALKKGSVSGDAGLAANSLVHQNQAGGAANLAANAKTVETAVSIASFKVLGGSLIELSYKGLTKTGTLVVEGCEGLGKTWTKVKCVESVPIGDGNVTLTQEEVGECRFYRMKLLTEE